MQLRNIHPFPARMAPELALKTLHVLPGGSLVLDPMAGSGTVLRQALELGHDAIGFDVDPLAVLMSSVWTTKVKTDEVTALSEEVLDDARLVDLRSDRLAWLRGDQETLAFMSFWFAPTQKRDLHRIAYVLDRRVREGTARELAKLNVLRIALSRLIVTKEQVASLARDTSHSRPHKVAETSDFDVFAGFARSVDQVCRRLDESPVKKSACVRTGDARNLNVEDHSVDSVMTSPPYLNAIDYLRGHRMSLVWLGHQISALRSIRSSSIGAERSLDSESNDAGAKGRKKVALAMVGCSKLELRHERMVDRYAHDLQLMTREVQRVLKSRGRATFVVGNSCLKGAFISNSSGVREACRLAGLKQVAHFERELPPSNRYLPVTDSGALAMRMRTEVVMTFAH